MTTPIRSAHEMREAAAKVFDEDILAQAVRLRVAPMTGQSPGIWRDQVRKAAIAALQIEIAPVAAGEFVLVPTELAPEMYRDAASEFRYGHSLSELWRVLLSAAPQAAAPESEVEPVQKLHMLERSGVDFYAGLYAERCGDVLRLREALARIRRWMPPSGQDPAIDDDMRFADAALNPGAGK
jgi:hypothetical protein